MEANARNKLERYHAFIIDLPDGPIKKRHLSSSKLLVAMLGYAPNEGGRGRVADEILRCKDETILQRLGVYYRVNLIAPYRALGGRTLAPSAPPSEKSTQIDTENISGMLETAKRDQGTLKRLSLRRDNYRCLATNALDLDTSIRHPEYAVPGDFALTTQAVHIIPFALCNTTGDAQVQRNSSIWQAIKVFSGLDAEELNGEKINDLSNILTLSRSHHDAFSALQLWFEPVEAENSYRLRKSAVLLDRVEAGQIIRLTSSVPGVPLPKREYLALHAACANVAHASGVADELDEFFGEWEETKVLAADGSSFPLLDEALHHAAGISAF